MDKTCTKIFLFSEPSKSEYFLGYGPIKEAHCKNKIKIEA
jgi:hypothetical protein